MAGQGTERKRSEKVKEKAGEHTRKGGEIQRQREAPGQFSCCLKGQGKAVNTQGNEAKNKGSEKVKENAVKTQGKGSENVQEKAANTKAMKGEGGRHLGSSLALDRDLDRPAQRLQRPQPNAHFSRRPFPPKLQLSPAARQRKRHERRCFPSLPSCSSLRQRDERRCFALGGPLPAR